MLLAGLQNKFVNMPTPAKPCSANWFCDDAKRCQKARIIYEKFNASVRLFILLKTCHFRKSH